MNKPKGKFIVTAFPSEKRSFGESLPLSSLKDLARFSVSSDLSLSHFKENHRLNENFIETNFLVADDDSGTPVKEVIARHKELACIILTTRHHQIKKKTGSGEVKPACDRTRTIILTNEKIKNIELLRHNYSLLHQAYPTLDRNVKDAARLLFKAKDIIYINESGQPWIVSPGKWQKLKTKNHAQSKPDDQKIKGQLSRRTLRFFNFWNPDRSTASWHEEFIFVVQDLKAQNYSFEESEALLTAVTGYLTDEDLYQLYDIWWNRSFEISFRTKPFSKEKKCEKRKRK